MPPLKDEHSFIGVLLNESRVFEYELRRMTEYTVDSIGVVSLAKILGAIGLLWGIILAISWIILGGPMGGRPGLPELLIAIGGGAVYGVIGGAITAIIYNAAAGIAGGIELELS